jgi:uncharacterized protein YukE
VEEALNEAITGLSNALNEAAMAIEATDREIANAFRGK